MLRVVAGCLVCLGGGELSAADLLIEGVERGPDGRVSVRFVGESASYYLLFRGTTLGNLATPVGIGFGANGPQQLPERAAAPGNQAYYRLVQRPQAQPGDVDQDGLDDVAEMIDPLRDPLDAADAFHGLTTLTSSPRSGEGGVAVTRETVVSFSQPLAPSTTFPTNAIFAETAGRRILTRSELASDLRSVTLFYLEPLPGNARVRVTVDGNAVADRFLQLVDADGDGQPGGVGTVTFDTLATEAIGDTGVEGHVYASERNAQGGNQPLVGVVVTVDGREETLRTLTDVQGFFRLSPCPAGRFFVHVDGRTAVGSDWPNGVYYPFVGKAWEAVAGRTNNLAGGTGEIYLPRVPANALQPVSSTVTTAIGFTPEVVQQNPALAGVEIFVPPNSLYNEQGTRGGRVGMAPVSPERLPEPLPPGLNLPLVITIQTDGAMNFDQPVPVRFPNLPDPVTGELLPPGARSAIWSFNHDTGRWEMQGPATVTADGLYVESDPGVGIRQPGWNGAGPGSTGRGGGPPPCPNCNRKNPDDEEEDCLGGECDPKDRKCPPTFELAYKGKGLCFIGAASGTAACLIYEIVKDKLDPCNLIDTFGIDSLCSKALDLITPGAEDCIAKVFDDGKTCLDFYNDCLLHYGTAALQGPGPLPPGADTCNAAEADFLAFRAEFLAQRPVMTEMWSLLTGVHAASDVTPALLQQLDQLAAQLRSLRGGRDKYAYFEYWLARFQVHQSAIVDAYGLGPQQAEQTTGPGSYELTNLDTGFTLRGATAPDGSVPAVVLTPRNDYRLVRYFPGVHRMNFALFRSADSGAFTEFPLGFTRPAVGVDTDGDGLPDRTETVLGTRPDLEDSDGDGVSDRSELLQGTSPLDNTPLAAGVLASSDSPGVATALVATQDRAYVGDSTSGIAVFRVSGGLAPVLEREFRPASGGTPLTLGTGAGRLAVSVRNPAALEVYDLGSPDEPHLQFSVALTGAANAVAIGGGVVYVGLAKRIEIRDLDTGDLINTITPALVGSEALQQLEVYAGHLYALTSTALRIFRINHETLDPLGTLPISGAVSPLETGRLLALGEGRAYAGYFTGYTIVDTTDPSAPVARGVPPTTQAAVHSLAAASGVRLAAVTSSAGTSTLAFSLYDTTEPTNTTRFLTGFDTPGDARRVSVYGGLAYVADGASGLAVVHFQQFGNAPIPPTVTLRAHLAPGTTEPDSSGWLELSAVPNPDRAVLRAVEFYIDGLRQEVDGGYPFEAWVRVPALTATKTNFVVRARAIETGGRATWSNELTFNIGPDTTPLRLHSRTPEVNTTHDPGVPEVSARFNRALLPTSLNAGLTVMFAGEDGTLGTADDVPVPGGLQLVDGGERVRFVGSFTRPGRYRVTVLPTLKSAGGQAYGKTTTWDFQITQPGSLSLAPLAGSYRPGVVKALAATFTHVMDVPSLKQGGLRLISAGPDQQMDTADDVQLPLTGLTFDPITRVAKLPFSPALASGTYRFLITTNATDPYGNRMALRQGNYTVAFPAVTNTTPADGHARQEGGLDRVAIQFSDAMDPAALPANVRIAGAGPDGALGTGDDTTVNGTLTYDPGHFTATLALSQALGLGNYRLTVAKAVRDAFGNSPRQDFTANFAVHGPVRWNVDANGFWDVATNWTPARPVPEDAVIVDRAAGDFVVTHRLAETTLLSRLQSREAIRLTKGTLALQQESWISNQVSLAGGAVLEHRGTLGIAGELRLDNSRVRSLGGLRVDGQTTIADLSSPTPGFEGSGPVELRGGGQFSGTEIGLGGIQLRLGGAHVWSSHIRFDGTGPSALEIEPGAALEWRHAASTAEWLITGLGTNPTNGTQVSNRGALRKTGPGKLALVNLAFDNASALEVQEGRLSLRSPGTHDGTFTIGAGATLAVGQLPATQPARFRPGAKITGPGNAEFIGNNTPVVIEGDYTVTGTTTIAGANVEFRGSATLGTGTLVVDDGKAQFLQGLPGQIGPVVMGPSAELELGAATTLPSLLLWGRLGGAGDVVALTRVPVGDTSNVGNFATIDGAGRFEARDGFTLRRDLTIGGSRVVEHEGTTVWLPTDGAHSVTIDAGARFRNRPGAELELQHDWPIEGNGVFENQGRLRKTDGTGISEVFPSYEGTGLVQVAKSRLRIRRGTFAGEALVGTDAILELGQSPQFPMNVTGRVAGDGDLILAGSTVVTGGLIVPCIFIFSGTHEFVPPLTLGTFIVSNATQVTIDQQLTLTGASKFTGLNTTIQGPGRLRNEGTMDLGSAILNCPVENAGTWNSIITSVPRLPGLFRNLPGATFTLTEASSEIAGSTLPVGSFDNLGLLRKTGPNSARLRASVTNHGIIDITGGRLQFTFPFIQDPASTVRLQTGGLIQVTDPLTLSSRFEGNGSIDTVVTGTQPGMVRNDGVLSPGLPVGKLTVLANFTQLSGGSLHIQIGGLTPVTEYDVLAIAPENTPVAASFDGELVVELVNGFVPAIGDKFLIVTGPIATGVPFATRTGLDFAPGRRFQVNRLANGIELEAVPTL